MALTNNLIERSTLTFEQGYTGYYTFASFGLSLYNTLFAGAAQTFKSGSGGSAWTIKDNLFDADTLTISGTYNVTADYNAYRTNLTSLGGSNNKVDLQSPLDYQSGAATNLFGAVGSFYYPASGGQYSLTNLLNSGSRNATNAWLYHFTTTTNQVKEGSTQVDIGYHYVALNGSNLPIDTDNEGLADYSEDKNGNGDGTDDPTNWNYADTDGDGLNDLNELELQYNVLVNDPAQDYANEQNSQFESTCTVLGNTVLVAWVDSNLFNTTNGGVYSLGADPSLTNYTPRFVGYAVSRDGGATFQDKGVPPLSRAGDPTNDDGDAGDPVLAVDRGSGAIYLAGTSPRNGGQKGIPLWKSTDGGAAFQGPTIVREDITQSDKEWIAVDNGSGTGQHDVYLACKGIVGTSPQTNGLWLCVSTNGTDWPSAPVALRETDGTSLLVQSAIPVVGPGHTAYAFWIERADTGTGTNWLKMCPILNRGTALGDIQTVRQLLTTNSSIGNLELKRSNTATNTDTFRVFPFPVPAANPVKTNHLYVAYADKGQGSDKADVFFLSSTDGGTNWSQTPTLLSTVSTNDQSMPVLAVKPDGTKIFAAWYDRRDDTNNSLIDVYGRWGTIASDGTVTFSTNDFRITTANFPPVFAGTDTNNTAQGHYDPVYPPGMVNLHWHYPEWSTNPLIQTSDVYKDHVGEYNGAWAEGQCVYITWTDNRLAAEGTLYGRNQGDIRFVRISWP